MVGGKEVPGCNGDIGAYVAKVLPGGAAEQTGKILEGKLFFQIVTFFRVKKMLQSTSFINKFKKGYYSDDVIFMFYSFFMVNTLIRFMR